MPDKRLHRGPHPHDAALFAPPMWPVLRQATDDLCWLLGRGYADVSALKLVGDRYRLTQRQRTAVARCACAESRQQQRQVRCLEAAQLAGQTLLLDGYNVLTTVEAALAGGVLLHARDGCYRDLASVHGTFRQVQETRPALSLVGQCLAQWRVAHCRWYLDRPVSNSGRLKTTLLDVSAAADWPWSVELVTDPDAVLAASSQIVATADSGILDRCGPWFNLARQVVDTQVPQARVIDLSQG